MIVFIIDAIVVGAFIFLLGFYAGSVCMRRRVDRLRCRSCGAMARADGVVIHFSGCELGWPDALPS